MNYDLYRAINGLSGSPLVDAAMKFAAQYLLYVMILLFALVAIDALRRGRAFSLAQAMVTLAVAFVFGLVASALHREARPFSAHPSAHLLIQHAAGQSFPSDHATAAFAIACATFFFLSRRWGVALLMAAVWIAFARVYVGVHYPGDVLASVVVAFVGVATARILSPALRTIVRRIPVAGRN